MWWQIDGTTVEKTTDGDTTRQIPTFFLNGNIQGIVNAEHAAKIATGIVNPTGDESLEVHINATSVFPG
jgi:hypothetical protein